MLGTAAYGMVFYGSAWQVIVTNGLWFGVVFCLSETNCFGIFVWYGVDVVWYARSGLVLCGAVRYDALLSGIVGSPIELSLVHRLDRSVSLYFAPSDGCPDAF